MLLDVLNATTTTIAFETSRTRRQWIGTTLDGALGTMLSAMFLVRPLRAQEVECENCGAGIPDCGSTGWGCGSNDGCADHPCGPFEGACFTGRQCWTTLDGECCDCYCECGEAQVICYCMVRNN